LSSLQKIGVALLLLAVCLGSPDVARADGRAAAESLFLDGRRLMDAERYAEACQRFEDSQRMDPAAGTALNLARCYALTGRTASAWTLYREAAALASAVNQREREQAALDAAALLEPNLSRLILKREQPQPDLLIELDGSPAPDSLFVVATPVDPAVHEVVVSRNAKVLWRTTVEAPPGQVVEVSIPRFAPEPAAPAVAAGRAEASSNGPGRPASDTQSAIQGTRRIAAVGLAATSVLAMAYAAIEALRARSAYEDSARGCSADKCDAVALRQRELAFDRARRADISLVVAGGAALGAGVLWFTVGAPRTSGRANATAAPSFRVSWRARF
jgi:hypothetical protein